MRTEFFIAPRWETPSIQSLEDLVGLKTLRSHNILPEEMADLDFIVTGETDREPDWLTDEHDPVGVMKLPDEFVEALAELPDESLVEVSDEWGEAGTPGEASYLRDIRAMAQDAIARGEGLFVAVFY